MPVRPLLSICIPQYNRTDFLLESLRSFAAQSFRDFEVCVSDDCSSDKGSTRIIETLSRSDLYYSYYLSGRNLRYDANLRSAIDMARGRFSLLMGNDDCLADRSSLEWLAEDLLKIEDLGVGVTNYADYATGSVGRRVVRPEVVSGPDAAARHFRDFSFVSGVVLRTELARRFATGKWDGTEMYQMYLACRIVASGASLALYDRVLVRKDIQLPGQVVDSYQLRPREKPKLFRPLRLPLQSIPALVFDAIRSHAGGPASEARLAWLVACQVQLFTFPFWLVEYRRVQSFRYSVGLWCGMQPARIFGQMPLGWRWALSWLLWLLAGWAALLFPLALFGRIQESLHWLAKRSSLPAL
jgi:hypothetical protein